MSRNSRSEKRVGKTEDQLGMPHARTVEDEAIKEIRYLQESNRDLRIVSELNKTIPYGIIRAYRKAIRGKDELNKVHIDRKTVDGWFDGVIWELTQLYPDLRKLPKER